MAWAYSLLAYCTTPWVLLYLWWRGRKDPGYRLRWRERFGLQGAAARHQGGVLLHCASVGEVIAARPLIEALLADPRYQPLVLTCTTPTGSRLIWQHYGERVGHLYFPLDLPGATRRFLRQLRPCLVLLLERELWPNFLRQAQAHGIAVVLVNARLSAGSAAGYTRWRSLMAPAIATLRLVCTEDTVTAGRFRALGVPAHRLAVTGNIKSDVRLAPGLREKIDATRALLGRRPVLTAGSTHPGEDEVLITALKQHLASFPHTLLILVPRHPERFPAVARLLQHSGLRFVRHSLGQAASADTQVLLGDTLGEMMLWYGVADACFVGGSLVERGGHNPLEVLCLEKPLIAGPHIANFEQFYTALQAACGMLPAGDAVTVFQRFGLLLQDPAMVRELVAGGNAVYQRLAGATARTMAQLATLPGPMPAPRNLAALVVHDGPHTAWFDPQCFKTADLRLFDLAWWQQLGGTSSRGAGRGQVHFVGGQTGAYLLRHYHRGGLMARFSSDLFLARRVAKTRAMAEFSLLARLHARGLPVPRACAARHTRAGLCYRADILVEIIPDAGDVAELLHTRRALAPEEWQVLGRAVRALHEEQVHHADLNCHNLMLDTRGKAWIVDFDKCGFRAGEAWKQDNLDRLQRSLRKELRLDNGFRWSDGEWPHFLAGYQLQLAPKSA